MNTSRIIDGKLESAALLEEVRREVFELGKLGLHPRLAVVLVGNDPASSVYVRNKLEKSAYVGIGSTEITLPTETTSAALLKTIATLNSDDTIHGILVQLPLPDHMNEEAILEAIDPAKDVDGFHSLNVGALHQGRRSLVPCTPAGCLYLLKRTIGDLSGKHAVVIGRSNIVGKPMAALLLQNNCTVSIVHSRSKNAAAISQQADIVVAAVGRPQMINSEWIKPGAVVIDVGINVSIKDGVRKLVGDVDFDNVFDITSSITPVPGGVGPMTIAFLMKNTVDAAKALFEKKCNLGRLSLSQGA
jgi:methylenetetrahydrofolate dehydrogenase (NADP+)/methenyltetrahydrofolate cyclohydrolase